MKETSILGDPQQPPIQSIAVALGSAPLVDTLFDFLYNFCTESRKVVRAARGDNAVIGRHFFISPVGAGILHIRFYGPIGGCVAFPESSGLHE